MWEEWTPQLRVSYLNNNLAVVVRHDPNIPRFFIVCRKTSDEDPPHFRKVIWRREIKKDYAEVLRQWRQGDMSFVLEVMLRDLI